MRNTSGGRNARISLLGEPGRSSPRRASVRAFLRSAPGSRRFSGERVPPRTRRTDRTWKPPRRPLPRTGRKGLSLSWRRRAFVLPRASLPGRPRRRRCPPPVATHRNGRITRLRCVRACASYSAPAPSGVGSRGSFPHRGPQQPCLSRSGCARRPAPSRRRLRTSCAQARGDVSRTWGTIPARVDRRRVYGDVHDLSRVPARGPYTASPSPSVGWNPDGGTFPWGDFHLNAATYVPR